MFRKLLLTSVASVALLVPFATASKADAYEWHREYRHEHVWRVYYRDPCRPVWVFAGERRAHINAERLAEAYRCRGFAVSIR
jgi:hypothetical protein